MVNNNSEYLKLIKDNDDIMIINKATSSCVRLKREIYDIISSIKTSDDLMDIAKEYCEEDYQFFLDLKLKLEMAKILEIPNDKKLKKVMFELTDSCNLFCSHCSADALFIPDASSMASIIVDMKLVKAVTALNSDVIVLTGGEPLLVSNLKEVTKYILENSSSKLILMTNATLINEQNIDFIASTFIQVDISIDGATEEQCDRVRGIGVYKKVMKAIDLLHNKKFSKISLSMAFDDDVSEYKNAFKELCEKKNVRALIRTMSPTGRAQKNHTKLKSCYDFLDSKWVSYHSFYNCPGGKQEIMVSSLGNVYPCSTFKSQDFIIGNVCNDDIISRLKWDESLTWFKNFKQFIPEYRDECKDCEVNPFCWSCPNSLNDFFNKTGVNKVKPFCSDKQKKMMIDVWQKEIPFYTIVEVKEL